MDGRKMIAGMRGKIRSFGASKVYLDVQGVIYEIHIPLNVFEALQQKVQGAEIELFIHHQYLPDSQRLYGFLDPGGRDTFGALQQIKGMGSSLALSVLSHLDGPTILRLCEKGDVEALKKIPRVGKSTAETIVFEVSRKKEKWRKLLTHSDQPGTDGGKGSEGKVDAEDQEHELAREALVQLGYKENQADNALERARKENPQIDLSRWIKEALRFL